MADGPPPVEGVDYAWSRPDIPALASSGKRFACRYGGPGSTGKQLDQAEARALSAAGIAVVANAEGAADGLLGGWSAGVSWARLAESHFASCGMPSGRPIYLSIDFDVQSGQWAAVASALRGAAEVLGGVHRVGVYGSRRAIEWARRDGVAQWFWQTYAWSAGIWAPGNHIEQYRNGVALAGATLDLDRALASDFGQWTAEGVLTGKAKTMHVLVKSIKDPLGKVFLADGLVRRWLETEQDVLDAIYLAETGQTAPLYRHGEIQEVANLDAYGREIDAGAPVALSETDRAAISAAVVAGVTPLLPTPQEIAVAVADEDHRRSEQ